MMSLKDLAWLGGLLEGEGCFMIPKGSPRIALAMSDKDVVQRAARLMGLNVQAPCHPDRVRTALAGAGPM